MKREPVLYEVCVFPRPEYSTRKPMAYTRYYNPAWKGACIHRVLASTGSLAKIAAIHEHQSGTGCHPNGQARP